MQFNPLPNQPIDEDGPTFKEPWEAQAFAMAVSLQQKGVFTWSEWTQTIGKFIADDPEQDKTGERYYQYWLTALEQLVTDKTDISKELLTSRKDQWDKAARSTPHGQPINLPN